MPWDLIFYGATAITFIGIIAASSHARRGRNGGVTVSDAANGGPARPRANADEAGGAPG